MNTIDTRETGFVAAISAAGITYAVTRACTMGDLVECSCDKNHIMRRLQYETHKIADDDDDDDIDVSDTNESISNRHSAVTNRKRNHKRKNRHRSRFNRNNINNNDYLLRNRNIYRNVILPEGNWEWSGCSDNVMFGFHKSKEFLDSRYRRRSDIKTLVKLHNNNAGRLVSDFSILFVVFFFFSFRFSKNAINEFNFLSAKQKSYKHFYQSIYLHVICFFSSIFSLDFYLY